MKQLVLLKKKKSSRKFNVERLMPNPKKEEFLRKKREYEQQDFDPNDSYVPFGSSTVRA